MATWSELKIKLIDTGDETGTWGDTTNENLGTAIEQAITGSTDITFLDDNVTLVLLDTTALQQARALRLNLIGTVTASKYLQVPDIQKYYIVSNTLTENIVIQNSTGTDYTVPAGTTAQVFSTGTGIKNALSFFSGAILSPAAIIGGGTIDDTAIGLTTPNIGAFTTLDATTLTLTNALAVADGGTGVALSTGTTKVVLSDSPTLTGSPLAPTQTAGDNSTKIATTAYVETAVTNGLGTLGTIATQNANNVSITGGSITGITDLTVADGGTGASSITANSVILGNGTSALSGNLVAPSTSGNVLTSNGTTWTSAAQTGLGYNQSWTVTSKVAGTTYTNSTGKPIMVLYRVTSSSSSSLTVNVNGVTILNQNAVGNSSYTSFIVPPNNTYRVDATNILTQLFSELA